MLPKVLRKNITLICSSLWKSTKPKVLDQVEFTVAENVVIKLFGLRAINYEN